MEQQPSKRKLSPALQFSIVGLLLATLWFASSLAGYRNGFSNGYKEGTIERQADEMYTEIYDVYEWLPASYEPDQPDLADWDPLMSILMQNNNIDSWQAVGGYGRSLIDPYQATLVIYNYKSVHETIVERLKETPKTRDPSTLSLLSETATGDETAGGNGGTGYGTNGYGGGGYGGMSAGQAAEQIDQKKSPRSD